MSNTGRFVVMCLLPAVLVAACTTTPQDLASTGSVSAEPQPGLAELAAFSQCMRDNGIADFPDPDPNGGLNIAGLPIDPDAAEFAAAREACSDLLPSDMGEPGQPGADGRSEWDEVFPGGDCLCADGSDFAFWVREADLTKVVFYLEGGGACFDATTCAFTGEGDPYDWTIANETPGVGGGIFDFDREDNPFADYSFVWVSSCTGDAYLGDSTHVYGPDLIVEHNGFVNGIAALEHLVAHFPEAEQVVVLGKTSGSIAAPIYGGLVSDLLPDSQVIVLGAQSGGFPDDPDFNTEILGELWGAHENMPAWEVNEGLSAQDWGPTRFWVQAGLHDPEIVMARFDYAYDRNAAATVEYLSGIDGSNLLSLIDANEAVIEDAGVEQHSYTAPGDDHGVLEFDTFYKLEVNEVRLVDWAEALLSGTPPEDVHCVDCEVP